MKKILPFLLFAAILSTSCGKKQPAQNDQKIIVAYVIGWDKDSIIPDPQYMTHINYAFAHVTDSFDGIRIGNPDWLKMCVGLKKQKPELKVLLSIGGWGSGRFSEMAADESNRAKFTADCKRVVDEYGLDGIDIDWEYPTSSEAEISSSPDDTENYTLLMRDIRKQIGNDKLLTLASDKSAGYIDFRAIDQYIDFVNVMAYDMAKCPKHHAGMYRSEMTGRYSCEESIQLHLDAGIPMNKLVFGMPFYGHGRNEVPFYIDYKEIVKLQGLTPQWDDMAKIPYMTNAEGEVVLNYEIPRSIAIKCDYIHEKGMKGAMYWEYSADDYSGPLRKAVYEGVFRK